MIMLRELNAHKIQRGSKQSGRPSGLYRISHNKGIIEEDIGESTFGEIVPIRGILVAGE